MSILVSFTSRDYFFKYWILLNPLSHFFPCDFSVAPSPIALGLRLGLGTLDLGLGLDNISVQTQPKVHHGASDVWPPGRGDQ